MFLAIRERARPGPAVPVAAARSAFCSYYGGSRERDERDGARRASKGTWRPHAPPGYADRSRRAAGETLRADS